MPYVRSKDCQIEEPDDWLLAIKVKLHQTYSPSGIFGFGKSTLRTKLEKLFKKGQKYTVLRTQANPELWTAMWEHRHELGKRFWPDSYNEASGDFSPDVMDTYMDALNKLARVAYIAIPIVQTDGVHNLDRHWTSPLWPVTHIFRTSNAERCVDLVHRLSSDEAYEIIKKHEAHQNYRMPIIDHIREQDLDPVVLFGKPESFDAETLRFFINHFAGFVHSYSSHSGCCFEDD